jgi:hypothetical protein
MTTFLMQVFGKSKKMTLLQGFCDVLCKFRSRCADFLCSLLCRVTKDTDTEKTSFFQKKRSYSDKEEEK